MRAPRNFSPISQLERPLHPSIAIILSQHGNTPLHYAAQGGHLEVVQVLHKHGADTTLKNKVSTVVGVGRKITIDSVHHVLIALFCLTYNENCLLLPWQQYGRNPLDEALRSRCSSVVEFFEELGRYNRILLFIVHLYLWSLCPVHVLNISISNPSST